MNDWLLWGIVVLATFRLTVLVTTDKISEPLRTHIAGKASRGDVELGRVVQQMEADQSGDTHEYSRPRLAYLVKCDWCSSVWLSTIPTVLALVWAENRVVLAVLIALSASAVTGILSTIVTLMSSGADRLDS